MKNIKKKQNKKNIKKKDIVKIKKKEDKNIFFLLSIINLI